MAFPERQKVLLRFADLLEANQEYLAHLTRLTLGAPYLPFGKSEIGTAIGSFRCTFYYIKGPTQTNVGINSNPQKIMQDGSTNSQASPSLPTMVFTRLYGMSLWESWLGMSRGQQELYYS